ncbi:response regulator [Catenovulum adriaticum]|uniref:histidine kinase n=1 Tax=Catenovulum adriaticum TaxID=2984846 RepID=A0ABY7AL70_9ALTE|nr:response regulator [Catenovulum sp. TS8]WAJ69906.1 response regulator [Catenovulum sp. TS8]
MVKNKPVFSRIKRQYKLVIVLLILSISASTVASLYVLYQQTKFASYINLAGRQRMLSQKINLQAYQILDLRQRNLDTVNVPDIKNTLAEFNLGYLKLTQASALTILSDENQLKVNQFQTPSVRSIQSFVEQLSADVQLFLNQGSSEQRDYQILFNSNKLEQLLIALEQVVTVYQQQAENMQFVLKVTLLAIWLITLILIVLIVVYIVKPTQAQIVRLFKRQERSANQLIIAKEQAEHANSVKSQLLTNISHEVRTPLNGVLGMLNIMKNQRHFDALHVQKAEQSALDLMAILDFILEFADLEQDKVVIYHKSFSFTQLLSDKLELWRAQANAKGLELEMNIAANVPCRFESDVKALDSILSNLCSNALKFTEIGHVIIDIQLLNTPTEQSTDGVLILKITDTGVGMPNDMVNGAFDAFNQQSKGLARNYAGCGIGLSIVKKLVQLLSGEIAIESQLGKGTCVVVSIPIGLAANNSVTINKDLLEQHKPIQLISNNQVLQHHYSCLAQQLGVSLSIIENYAEIESALSKNFQAYVLFDLALLKMNPQLNPPSSWALLNTHKHQSNGLFNSVPAFLSAQQLAAYLLGKKQQPNTAHWPGKRILVVEDNEINQEVIQNLLEVVELEVDIAADGYQAIEKVQQHHYSLILMDLQMPKLDGLSATKQIRELTLSHQPPIVALTAHALRADEQACYDVGMDSFLTKPINADNLYNVLRRFLTV